MRRRMHHGQLLAEAVAMVVVSMAACRDESPAPEKDPSADRLLMDPAPTEERRGSTVLPDAQDLPPPKLDFDSGSTALEPTARPELASDPAAGEGAEPPVNDFAPTIRRSDDRVVVSTSYGVEELILMPKGLAFIHWGRLWILDQHEMTLERVPTKLDPHGIASDDRWLYWLGDDENGKLNLDSGKVEWLPPMSFPGANLYLAAGDVLYGRSLSGVHRYKGGGVIWLADADELPGHFGRGFQAADRQVVFPIIRGKSATEPELFVLLRMRVDGTFTHIPTHQPLNEPEWSVSPKGSIVFLGPQGQVLRHDGPRAKVRELFVEPGVEAVCWCGRDVCTVDADDDVIRRHRRGAAESTVIVEDVGAIRELACGADRIAWSRRVGPDRASEIQLVSTR